MNNLIIGLQPESIKSILATNFAAKCQITSERTEQVSFISSSVKVGCTKNIKEVSPSSFATGKRSLGR